ncbi:hypothetical protein [Campylobacter sp. MIT 97-5078]|nr:hypothetical protein [Campylobacter sp. MIT 97-5078]
MFAYHFSCARKNDNLFDSFGRQRALNSYFSSIDIIVSLCVKVV